MSSINSAPIPLKITVITAVYNGKDTVVSAIESVANQTWPNINHVVIDGCSNDGTVEILRRILNPQSVFISEPDNGIYDALNKGIAHSSGDVIGFLHSDDVFANIDVLAHVAQAFADSSVCAVYGDLQYVRKDDTNQIVRHWHSSSFTPRRLSWGWMPPHPTFYVRRQWYDRIGGFDSRFRISADYLSILQLFSQPDFRAVYLPEVLVKMRLGGVSNKSIKCLLLKSLEDWLALRTTGVGALYGVGALVWKNLSKVGQFI